jgi:hypothetical protein
LTRRSSKHNGESPNTTPTLAPCTRPRPPNARRSPILWPWHPPEGDRIRRDRIWRVTGKLRRIDYWVVPQCVSSFRSHHSWHFLNEAGNRRVDQTGQAARRRYTSRTFRSRKTSNHRAVSAPNAFRAATESRRAAQLTFHEVHPPHSRLQVDELAREKAPPLPDRRRLWSTVGRTGPCR